jgi:hypothetical protein
MGSTLNGPVTPHKAVNTARDNGSAYILQDESNWLILDVWLDVCHGAIIRKWRRARLFNIYGTATRNWDHKITLI